jgi:exodeoxyribonuclease VII large subunit
LAEVQLGGAGQRRPFRVSELAGGLRELLEEEVGRVFVVGEISNLRRASSGHCYFTLKDDHAQLRAALFRNSAVRLPFDPEDGLEVLVEAEVTLYAARGDLQLIVRQMEPRGQGALQLAFEQLRARLEAEGLFDPARKRALPAWPRRVGVVTSPSGAALHDVIQVSGRRMPGIPLLIAPTRVQGDGAEEEIAAALAALGRLADVDVILLVRGGGSLEDLRPFNTERVARAIVASRVPVVAGVGHEVDLSIADLAADARAPTPSAAAALALPDRAAWRDRLRALERHLAGATGTQLARAGRRLEQLGAALRAHAPAARLAAWRARLGTLSRALEREGTRVLALRSERLAALAAQLDALSPLAVLGRGYAIARRPDGVVLRRAGDVTPGDAFSLRLGEGELEATATKVR